MSPNGIKSNLDKITGVSLNCSSNSPKFKKTLNIHTWFGWADWNSWTFLLSRCLGCFFKHWTVAAAITIHYTLLRDHLSFHVISKQDDGIPPNGWSEQHSSSSSRGGALPDPDPGLWTSTCIHMSPALQTHPSVSARLNPTCFSLHKRAQSSHCSEKAMNATWLPCSASSPSNPSSPLLWAKKKGIKLGKSMVASGCLLTAAFATIVLFCSALQT